MKRIVITVAILATIAAVVAALVSVAARQDVPATPEAASEAQAVVEATSSLPVMERFVWRFSLEGEDEQTLAPVSRIRLADADSGREYDLGTSLGACFVAEESSWGLLPGERTAAICYFGGGGDEYGIFEENGALTIRRGYVDEGSAETEGGREGFETVAEIR